MLKEGQILIQQEDEHNKFWVGHVDDKHVAHTRWGRLGTKGQSQSKKFDSAYDASSYIRTKYGEKLRKGYTNVYNGKIITPALFERLATEAAIVGTANKCTNFQWMEITFAVHPRTATSTPQTISVKPIDEERLLNPDCHPAIMIEVQTKKEYYNFLINKHKTNFWFLLTGEQVYLLSDLDYRIGNYDLKVTPKQIISPTTDLYQLIGKIEEAIGRSFTNSTGDES